MKNPMLNRLLPALIIGVAACGPAGQAPSVDAIDDQTVGVSDELVVRIHASDADGDVLRYSYDTTVPNIRARAELTLLPVGAAEFRWTPTADDIGTWYFDFHVSDGDFTTTRTIAVDVRSSVGLNGAPWFLRPSSNGKSFDLSGCNPDKEGSCCIELDIEIEDQDTVEVTIREEEPKIAGAAFDQTSGKTAEWSWCPTLEQLSASNRYSLSLSASDGENPATQLHYLLVLRREPKVDCPGEVPMVVDRSTDQSTLGHVQITADITDDKGLKEAPIVFYSESEPAEPANLASMELAVMSKTGLTEWTAYLPNPVAGSAEGATSSLYYFILVRDDDDAAGECDHEVLAPEDAAASIAVTHPGGFGQLAACEACTADVQCGSSDDDLCVRVGNRGGSSCLTGCESQADCAAGYQCSEDPIESVDGAFARQCVPIAESCDVECEEDGYEDNDSRVQADERAPLALGTVDATSCPISAGADDEDWWRIDLANDADVELILASENTSDLDLYLYDSDENFISGSGGFGQTEVVSICLNAGTYYIRVMSPNTVAQNDYSLDYTATTTTCEVAICNDQGPEPNETTAQATTVLLDENGSYSTDLGTICQGDEDWYVVNLFDGETITALIDFVHSEGDLDMAILDGDGTTMLDQGFSSSDGEIVQYTNDDSSCGPEDDPCVFYIAVIGFNNAQNDYTLEIEVSP